MVARPAGRCSVAWDAVLQLVIAVLGVVAGFGGARLLRRPSSTASAASIGRSVGAAVGQRRRLDLARLQRSTFSEMMRHVTSRGGRPVVPDAFGVRLHPDDHATVAQAPGFFTQGIEEAVRHAGRDHGWTVPARIRIEVHVDPARRAGVPGVDASSPATPDPRRYARAAEAPAPTSPPRPARLERSDEPGVSHDLIDDTATLGRGSDRTIRIDDKRASRRHASVHRRGDRWVVVDERSSNGTSLNGEELLAGDEVSLADGDEIGIGPVAVVFRAGDPGPPAPAPVPSTTRLRPVAPVLDDQQRQEISQEYLPDGSDAGPDATRRR